MRYLNVCFLVLLSFTMTVAAPFRPEASAAQALDTAKIEQILGIKGTTKAGEYKVSVPQNDLSVTVDGYWITAPMGLTTWVGFSPMPGGAMVMGDVIVQENEVAPVQKTIIAQGMTVTGLHNHFLRESRKVMYLHLFGMGPADKLARSVRAVLDKVKELRHGNPAAAQGVKVENCIDTARIESILGHKGETQAGVFKITIGRPDVLLTDQGMPVSTFMGFNTWAAFQGTEERAAIAGDFAVLDREVAPVIKALVEHGIEVVAVHNHMVTESPRIFFLHFWAVGPASELAKGLRAALDQTGIPEAKPVRRTCKPI